MNTTIKRKPAAKKAAKKKASRKETAAQEVDQKRASRKKIAGEKVSRKKLTMKKAAKEPPVIGVTPEERYKMIAVAAYLKAELRDFSPGNELQDWAEAEKEVDEQLRG